MTKNREPDFSVIVLFGRGRLEPCLSSVLGQKDASFEVIAVIDFEPPQTEDSRIRFLKITNLNPAQRRNQAAAAARGKFLAFIDDDATAPPDWLATAKTILETHPGMAGFGGANIAPEKMNWREQLVDLILTDRYFGSGSGSYKPFGKPHPARPGELHSSNLFVRREFFDQVKGFNEKIGYGAEDSELLYQLRKKPGLDLGFFPELFVWHKRRPFGTALLKRNFRFRRQNGRLMWLYPDMYMWNSPLPAGVGTLIFVIILLIVSPPAALFYFVIYFVFLFAWSLFRLKKARYLCLLAPFVYFFHHLSYVFGLAAGALEGLVRGREQMRRLYGRDDFVKKISNDKL